MYLIKIKQVGYNHNKSIFINCIIKYFLNRFMKSQIRGTCFWLCLWKQQFRIIMKYNEKLYTQVRWIMYTYIKYIKLSRSHNIIL